MPFTHLVPKKLYDLAGSKAARRAWHRMRPVPATGMPRPRERRRTGTLVSLIAHGLLVFMLMNPEAGHTDPNLVEVPQGGGGPGPAGGGGGGRLGTGGIKYVTLRPPPPPVVPPPVPTPTPQLVIEPPKPVVVEPLPPAPVKPAEEPKVEVKAQAPTPGDGGGTGRDTTGGNGPGTGGGVGSGIGTGRGSSVGPGTGGGNALNYSPTPIEIYMPPMPTPSNVKGFHLIAEFDVDETGKVVDFKFTPTRDKGYNRALEASLKSMRWRPAVTPEGKPIRAKAQITYDL
jgi:protein TonB